MARYRIVTRVAGWLVPILLLAGPAGSWAEAPALTDADRSAIRGVIQRQMDAFRRDDGPAAFALASPGIQARFGDATRFLAMVRESYQPVYRPREVKYLDATVIEGQVVQRVLVLGPDGEQVLALYPMVRAPNGSWATDGCLLVNLPSKSA